MMLLELCAGLLLDKAQKGDVEIKRQCERSWPSVEQESYSRDAIMVGDASVS